MSLRIVSGFAPFAPPTRAQLEWQGQFDRKRAEDALAKCNGLQFWRWCRQKPCRRAHSCKGDADECFRLKWQALPEEMRVWIRTGIKARAEGLSPSQATDVADAEVARQRELMAKYNMTFSGEPLDAAAQDGKETAEVGDRAMPRARGL
jgi:hypothetical protein